MQENDTINAFIECNSHRICDGKIYLSDEIFIDDGDIVKINFPLRKSAELRSRGIFRISDFVDNVEEKNNLTEKERSSYFVFVSNYICDPNNPNSYYLKFIKESIIDLVKESGFNGIERNRIVDRLQSNYRRQLVIQEISKLVDENIIYGTHKLIFKYESFFTYLSRASESFKSVLEERLSGKSCECIAQQFNSSKVYINCRINEFYNKLNDLVFYEDRYMSFFENYSITKDEFVDVFGEEVKVYMYLKDRCTNLERNKRNYVLCLEDPEISEDMKSAVRSHNSIEINGEYVVKSFNSLLEYYYRHYCVDEKSEAEIVDGLVSFNNQYQICDIDANTLVHSFRGYRERKEYIINGFNKKSRYYPMNQYDFSKLKDLLNKYGDKSIKYSTKKIFNENIDLMNEYGLRNYYELHNIINRCLSNEIKDLTVNRMPFITFGVFDIYAYARRIQEQNHYTRKADLYGYITEETGIDSLQLANMLQGFELM